MTSLSLWDTTNNKLAFSADSGLDYLNRNLGVSLANKRDKATLEAIKDPSAFVDARSKAIDKIVGGTVNNAFHTRITELLAMGLPDEVSKDLAFKHAAREYSDQLEMLELAQPGAYNRAFGITQLHHDAKTAEFNLATTKSDAVREYKERKRAKKALKNKK